MERRCRISAAVEGVLYFPSTVVSSRLESEKITRMCRFTVLRAVPASSLRLDRAPIQGPGLAWRVTSAQLRPCPVISSLTADASPTGGFTLAKLGLRAEKDLVSLSRRTRAAGEDFGLHPRDIRSLSAATYEVARLLYKHRGAEAEVRLADGPSLQVVVRVPAIEAGERAALKAQLGDAVRHLSAMVD